MSRKYDPSPRHVPFTVEAELSSAPIVTGPIMFDGPIHFAAGAVVAAEMGEGIARGEEFMHRISDLQARAMAVVRRHPLWWYAVSQATPVGPERRGYRYRRPAVSEVMRWTTAKSITIGSGPDKALRVPYFTRTAMLRLRWTGIGDIELIARLLAHVPSVGNDVSHGHGWVKRWTIRRGGPPFGRYIDDVTLRHLPTSDWQGDVRVVGRVSSKLLPLTPPYHERRRAVPVVQVAELG
jgi:CRISPR type IV-associated protein Csf3